MERISLGHISVNSFGAESLVDFLLEQALTTRQATMQVATLNAQFYVLSARHAEFRSCLERAEVLCADGYSICLASRWLTGARLERVTGVDLIGSLCRKGAVNGLRVYLLGGNPGSAVDTAAKLERECEGLRVVGVSCPEHGFETNSTVLASLLDGIADSEPDVVFVGLGAPKQEMFIDTYLRDLGIPVAIGVGGSFELLSGRLRRAPVWMRRSGLEWSFRLMQEPRRLWRRYCIGNVHFLWLVLGQLYRTRLQSRTQMLEP